jgi:hypothetical protein
MELGEKAKFRMVMVVEPDGLALVEVAGALPFEEQAANTRATPSTAVAAHRRDRPGDLRAMPSLVLAGRSVRRIARRSKLVPDQMYPDRKGCVPTSGQRPPRAGFGPPVVLASSKRATEPNNDL